MSKALKRPTGVFGLSIFFAGLEFGRMHKYFRAVESRNDFPEILRKQNHYE